MGWDTPEDVMGWAMYPKRSSDAATAWLCMYVSTRLPLEPSPEYLKHRAHPDYWQE